MTAQLLSDEYSGRKITKTARKVGNFTSHTLRADGIGTGESGVLHMIRKICLKCRNGCRSGFPVMKKVVEENEEDE